MPNEERLRLWIEDLRTTDVPQGRETLRSPDGDCCLGRACEVYRIQTGEGRWLEDFIGVASFRDGDGNEEFGVLPAGVAFWFGISQDPILRFGALYYNASELNDDKELSFESIANAVQKTFLYGEP